MSIYQCCKNPTNPQGKTAYHQQGIMLSEKNRNDCDPRRNFYKDMCKLLWWFEKKTDKKVLPMLIGDWNEEYIWKSNSKKLCNEFGLVNIFQGKFPNYEKFVTYQEGYTFIDYGFIHRGLIDKVDRMTYDVWTLWVLERQRRPSRVVFWYTRNWPVRKSNWWRRRTKKGLRSLITALSIENWLTK